MHLPCYCSFVLWLMSTMSSHGNIKISGTEEIIHSGTEDEVANRLVTLHNMGEASPTSISGKKAITNKGGCELDKEETDDIPDNIKVLQCRMLPKTKNISSNTGWYYWQSFWICHRHIQSRKYAFSTLTLLQMSLKCKSTILEKTRTLKFKLADPYY